MALLYSSEVGGEGGDIFNMFRLNIAQQTFMNYRMMTFLNYHLNIINSESTWVTILIWLNREFVTKL